MRGEFIGMCNVFVSSKLQKKGRALGQLQSQRQRTPFFNPIFFGVLEKRFEGVALGYQQVIHNAKILAGDR